MELKRQAAWTRLLLLWCYGDLWLQESYELNVASTTYQLKCNVKGIWDIHAYVCVYVYTYIQITYINTYIHVMHLFMLSFDSSPLHAFIHSSPAFIHSCPSFISSHLISFHFMGVFLLAKEMKSDRLSVHMNLWSRFAEDIVLMTLLWRDVNLV